MNPRAHEGTHPLVRHVVVFAVIVSAAVGVYVGAREGSRIWLRPPEPAGLSRVVDRSQASTIARRASAVDDRAGREDLLREVLGSDAATIDAALREFDRIVDFGAAERQAGRRAMFLAWIAVAFVGSFAIRRTRSPWWLVFPVFLPVTGPLVVAVLLWGWARRCPWVAPVRPLDQSMAAPEPSIS